MDEVQYPKIEILLLFLHYTTMIGSSRDEEWLGHFIKSSCFPQPSARPSNSLSGYALGRSNEVCLFHNLAVSSPAFSFTSLDSQANMLIHSACQNETSWFNWIQCWLQFQDATLNPLFQAISILRPKPCNLLTSFDISSSRRAVYSGDEQIWASESTSLVPRSANVSTSLSPTSTTTNDPVAQASPIIAQNGLRRFCSDLLGYTTSQVTFTISSAITTATVVTIGPINTATIQIDDVSFVATHIMPFLDVTVQVMPVISTTVEAIQVDTIISTDSTETLLSILSIILFTTPETISTIPLPPRKLKARLAGNLTAPGFLKTSAPGVLTLACSENAVYPANLHKITKAIATFVQTSFKTDVTVSLGSLSITTTVSSTTRNVSQISATWATAVDVTGTDSIFICDPTVILSSPTALIWSPSGVTYQ